MAKKESAEKAIKDIRRKTRRRFSAEEKIRIVMEGLRGEDSVAELCHREGISANRYYRWSKDFLEAGKKREAALSCPLHSNCSRLFAGASAGKIRMAGGRYGRSGCAANPKRETRIGDRAANSADSDSYFGEAIDIANVDKWG